MDNWTDLGRAVLTARLQGGYADTKSWAQAVQRSSRVLLGLERGEPVGPKTLAKIEIVLGWPVGWSHRILAGEVVGPPAHDGGYVKDAVDTAPAGITDEDLLRLIRRQREELDEIERRLRERSLGHP